MSSIEPLLTERVCPRAWGEATKAQPSCLSCFLPSRFSQTKGTKSPPPRAATTWWTRRSPSSGAALRRSRRRLLQTRPKRRTSSAQIDDADAATMSQQLLFFFLGCCSLKWEGKNSCQQRWYLIGGGVCLPASRVCDGRAVEMDRCCILAPHPPNETHFSLHHFFPHITPPPAVYGPLLGLDCRVSELHDCVPHRTLPTLHPSGEPWLWSAGNL